MERVTILEASRRLNIPQAAVRQHIRDGNLVAHREEGPRGRIWMVELPEDDWLDTQKEQFLQLAESFSPWWFATAERDGDVHYVEDIGIEEIIPFFLCGQTSHNIWTANGHDESRRCGDCVRIAAERDLPMSSSQ